MGMHCPMCIYLCAFNVSCQSLNYKALEENGDEQAEEEEAEARKKEEAEARKEEEAEARKEEEAERSPTEAAKERCEILRVARNIYRSLSTLLGHALPCVYVRSLSTLLGHCPALHSHAYVYFHVCMYVHCFTRSACISCTLLN